MLTVSSLEQIAEATFEMKVEGLETGKEAMPGQFLHIKIGEGNSHMLRRPISIADVDDLSGIITLIFKVMGDGTAGLSKVLVGEQIDALGPCGSSFPIKTNTMNKALLIGGGIGVPPLYYLGKQLAEQGIEVLSILGFQSKANVFYETKFNQLGETHIATNDASYGSRGFVTDVLEKLEKDWDYYFTCGPMVMLKSVANSLKDDKGYISIEQRMGCGIGACYACVIPTSDGVGFKKICKDGPVFEANEVLL